MEKQTMGKFIATLRKANGMTQSDLAERLGVSNKSVSKWECDDGYPDLSLIPIIAEIFDVTSDEILKGGRLISGGNSIPKQPKSEKQINALLQKTLTMFKNLSLFAVFLGVIGLIMACFIPFKPIVHSAITGVFYLILTLLSAIFVSASIILEIIFFNNAKSAIIGFGTAEDKRILKSKKILENWIFNIIVLDALVCLASLIILINGPRTYGFLLLPSIYIFAHIVKILLSDKNYFDITEQKQIIDKIKKANLVFIIISVIVLILPSVIYFSVLSGTPLLLKYLSIHSIVILPIGAVYIFIRKKLLKNYSKL